MWLRIKTLAGIFFKSSIACCLLTVFLMSCSMARYEIPSPVVHPHGFQEFRGNKQYVVASWYGPGFHGRRTASGEIYNMYALTCAHRELPFGTKLRVVNPQNNKEVRCIINDRGPFIAGRDLDLSYASAKEIGLIRPGVATVMIQPIGRDMRYVRYIKYGRVGELLTIQVGSFRYKSNAERLKRALQLRYKNVYIIDMHIRGTKHYRVRVGKFNSTRDAHRIGSALANEGYNVLITVFEQQI